MIILYCNNAVARQLPKQSTTINFWYNSLPVFGVVTHQTPVMAMKLLSACWRCTHHFCLTCLAVAVQLPKQSTTINFWYNPLSVFGVSFVTHQTLVMAIKLLSACWGCTHHFCLTCLATIRAEMMSSLSFIGQGCARKCPGSGSLCSQDKTVRPGLRLSPDFSNL